MSYLRYERVGCFGIIERFFILIIAFAFALAGATYVAIFLLLIFLIKMLFRVIVNLIKYFIRKHENHKRELETQKRIEYQNKMQEIENKAIIRNAELKMQDKKDNYKHYLDLYK